MKSYLTPFIVLLILTSCNMQNSSSNQPATPGTENPLLTESTLPYQTIPFDKIKEEDFIPALEQGMREEMVEIDSIADNPAVPAFENTFVALEKSGQLLKRANRALNALTSANTNDQLQKIQEEMAPKLSKHTDSIFMNAKLFRRVDTIYKQLGHLSLDAESKRLVTYYHQQFMMSGAALPDSSKSKLQRLNEEEATLSTRFGNQLLAAAKQGALVVDSKAELAGLTDAEIDAAAEAGKTGGHEGKYVLSLLNTTQQPALQSLKNRDVRSRLFEASWTRAEKDDSNDTRKNILRIAQIRKEKAALLGFPNYAAWKLQDQMAQTPEAVTHFFAQLVPAATAKARGEAAEIQAQINKQGGGFTLEPWDWNFYAE